jgi:predicted nucleic acid-binding Zn ribbon protein
MRYLNCISKLKRIAKMIGHCQYCGNKLENDVRVDMRFCSDKHRIQYHNEARRIRNLGTKAMNAIELLKEIAASDERFKSVAQQCIRLIARDITN